MDISPFSSLTFNIFGSRTGKCQIKGDILTPGSELYKSDMVCMSLLDILVQMLNYIAIISTKLIQKFIVLPNQLARKKKCSFNDHLTSLSTHKCYHKVGKFPSANAGHHLF